MTETVAPSKTRQIFDILLPLYRQDKRSALAAAKRLGGAPRSTSIEWSPERYGQPAGWKAVVMTNPGLSKIQGLPDSGNRVLALALLTMSIRKHLAGIGYTLPEIAAEIAAGPRSYREDRCRECGGWLTSFDEEAASVEGFCFDCA